MKKRYTPPAIKIVSFRPELGFMRSQPAGLFELELFDGRAREEQYQYDDWDNIGSSSSDGTRFQYDDWQTL